MERINTAFLNLQNLKAGQEVLLSGKIYTARDQAHKRLIEKIKKKKRLPISLENSVIYYCGPTPRPKGKIIGSCGPTTSSRMDAFTPALMEAGLKAMIGKGSRSEQVRQAIVKHKGIYFVTYAGCAAFLSKYVTKSKIIAYADLGPEAIMELEVNDFPLVVAIDSKGNDIFKRSNHG